MKEEINYFDTDTDTKTHTNLGSRYPMPHAHVQTGDRLGWVAYVTAALQLYSGKFLP